MVGQIVPICSLKTVVIVRFSTFRSQLFQKAPCVATQPDLRWPSFRIAIAGLLFVFGVFVKLQSETSPLGTTKSYREIKRSEGSPATLTLRGPLSLSNIPIKNGSFKVILSLTLTLTLTLRATLKLEFSTLYVCMYVFRMFIQHYINVCECLVDLALSLSQMHLAQSPQRPRVQSDRISAPRSDRLLFLILEFLL